MKRPWIDAVEKSHAPRVSEKNSMGRLLLTLPRLMRIGESADACSIITLVETHHCENVLLVLRLSTRVSN